MLGGMLLTLGCLLLTQLTADADLWVPVAIACVIGAGFGFVSVVTILAAQAAVGWDQRGVVTSANQFARNIGGTVGVPIAGAFFASYVASAAAAGLDPNSVLAPDMRSMLPLPDLAFLRSGLSDALRAVYVLFAVMGVLATLAASFFPGGPPTQAAETPVVATARGAASG